MQAHSIKGSGGQMGGQGTKGGAGTVRRARIQILSGVLSPPLSVGYNSEGFKLAARLWRAGIREEVAAPRRWKSTGRNSGFHHGLFKLHADYITFHFNDAELLWSVRARGGHIGAFVTGATRSDFTHGPVRGTGSTLAGEHARSSRG